MRGTGSPAIIRPMLAVAGELPEESGWAYEFKWDGVRALAYASRTGRYRLLSRNDKDVTGSYPELDVLPSLLRGRDVVLDGELITLDERGAPSFSALQRRMHVISPSPALVASTPVRYVLFDLPRLDRPLLDRPWSARRDALLGLRLDHPGVLLSPVFERDPGDVMGAAREQGLEGVVSKRVDSRYQPGRRSPDWRKTALIQTTEVIIGGWRPGEGRRAGTVGSLLLGVHRPDGGLAYVGGVGTGFTNEMLHDLDRRFRPLARETSPFAIPVPAAEARGARWVEPVLVGEVVYRTITPDGRLRHSAWRGLRPDREPGEVTLG
ncbi:non-homologous end-joining DNA ligase [Micromonospora sp. NPDC049559]|uniref:non-homologous end-joining DNA ligase n=1 Tax=Micromonospora sp. NPDC049559 TaxID=3155923 RepID=UPI003412D846